MAVIYRNSLVLLGVSVVRDVATSTMDNGNTMAAAQTRAMPFPKRLLSQGFSWLVQEPGQRQCLADYCGVDRTAARAGRPGSHPCVRASRPGAISAGWTSRKGWSLAWEGSCPNRGLRFGLLTARRRPASDNKSQTCLHASHRGGRSSSVPSRMLASRAHKRDDASLARFNPASGARPASTRG
jgi:hypothetical protein